jgi:HK97 family phage portal protein
MGLLDLFGRPASGSRVEFGSDGDWWRSAFTPWPGIVNDSIDVGTVTQEQAAGLPGIGRGVELIAGVMAQMPLALYRNQEQPDQIRSTERLATPPLLRNPDPYWHGRDAWISAVASSLVWYGDAFAYRGPEVSDYRGFPLRLPLFDAEKVSYGTKENGVVKTYQVVGENGWSEVEVPDMLHMVVGARAGKRMGQGVLDRYQRELRLMVATENSQYVLMNSGQPVGIVSLDVDLNQAEADAVKAGFLKAVRTDGYAVMGKASFSPVSFNSNDLSMIPTREFHLRLASDIVGVPPYLLGVPSESRVYANMETEWATFIKVTLGRYIAAIETGLSSCFPREVTVRFSLDSLLRSETKNRWETYKIASDIGALTIDEIRQSENLPPMPASAAPAPPADPAEGSPEEES